MYLLIENIKKHIPLSEEDIAVVRKLFTKKSFKKREHLLEVGKICRHIIFLEKGLVRYYINSDGAEQTNYFNKEDEFVCDYMSFLPQGPSRVNIQALEDTTAYLISFDGIQQFYREVAHGEKFGRLAIEQVFVNLINQVVSLYTDTPEIRYHKFLLNYPEIMQRIPQYYIASYIGVKPPSLSRIRKRIAARR